MIFLIKEIILLIQKINLPFFNFTITEMYNYLCIEINEIIMSYPGVIKLWLLVGVIMVFIQVLVGGITRLTESGLSITKWEVISGTLPPMSEEAWLLEFEKYKETPQYAEINEGMEMSDFKFIYFWEYIHRLWARIMGFVFLIPFVYFWYKGWIDRSLMKKLAVVIFFAGLAAIFGWIMVASGLVERPWVNAYKLSIHLLIAVCVFISLFWTYLSTTHLAENKHDTDSKVYKSLQVLLVLVFVQLIIGGVLSGMKAAVVYPSWPDMNGQYLPDILQKTSEWKLENFYNYDKNPFMPAFIHFIHRSMGYIIFVFGVYICFKLAKDVKMAGYKYVIILPYAIISSILMQIILGIITVLNSKGSIPVFWGVAHQGFALCLIAVLIFSIFILRIKIRNK